MRELWAGKVRVGRTLLSDALDFDFGFALERNCGAETLPRQPNVKGVGQKCPTHTGKSNIQVFHVQRVLFDKLTARFYVFAHEGGEDGFTLG